MKLSIISDNNDRHVIPSKFDSDVDSACIGLSYNPLCIWDNKKRRCVTGTDSNRRDNGSNEYTQTIDGLWGDGKNSLSLFSPNDVISLKDSFRPYVNDTINCISGECKDN